jgi:hypothetical protein
MWLESHFKQERVSMSGNMTLNMTQTPSASVSLKTNPLLAQWLRFEADGSSHGVHWQSRIGPRHFARLEVDGCP